MQLRLSAGTRFSSPGPKKYFLFPVFTFESTEILSIKVLGNETKYTGLRDMSHTDIREDLDERQNFLHSALFYS